MANEPRDYNYGAEGPPETPVWFFPLFVGVILAGTATLIALLLQARDLIS